MVTADTPPLSFWINNIHTQTQILQTQSSSRAQRWKVGKTQEEVSYLGAEQVDGVHPQWTYANNWSASGSLCMCLSGCMCIYVSVHVWQTFWAQVQEPKWRGSERAWPPDIRKDAKVPKEKIQNDHKKDANGLQRDSKQPQRCQMTTKRHTATSNIHKMA